MEYACAIYGNIRECERAYLKLVEYLLSKLLSDHSSYSSYPQLFDQYGITTMEVNFLKKELEETKKVKQDEALRSFEVLTKGDANALKREEKLDVEMKQGAGASDTKPEDSTVVRNLKKENSAMKKQIDEILKVNNEWDQHYAGMKSSFEAKLKKIEEDNMRVKEDLDRKMKESLQRMAAENQKESILDKKQREFDQMLTQAKARIDAVEAEKVEHQNRSARLEKWVHMLLVQKAESEVEIARLNQELENCMRNIHDFKLPLGAAAAYSAPQRNLIPRGIDNDVTQRMQEQMDLLQQQNMAFQSDFNQERRDRQHAVGQLTEAKEEIEALRKIAMDLQEQVNSDARKVKRPPGVKGYYIQEVPPGGKIFRRGINYGGNDMFVDNDIEIDGPDGTEQPDPESECPMCQRVIPNKEELERHVERCTNNFD
ncbi:TNFAIP3-interacting protein 1-like [Anneissia japonica]|uniref:TNFAIP3-interacting protein 1-like n=1 Tax=Anneissia japonica TaxID=1529436 RepID=UPI001425A422|nr:TNFAIP3-interacting protein 1-like [Anneissia japonica]